MTQETVVEVRAAEDVFEGSLNQYTKFTELVEERQSLKRLLEQTEAGIKDIDKKLTEIMTDRTAPKVKYGQYTVSLVMGQRSSLSETKLLEKGVTAATIAACKVLGKSYTYVLVNTDKPKRGET